jgi:hypothetical protein
MKKIVLIVMLAIAASAGITPAQVVLSDKTGWHKIGQKTLVTDKSVVDMSVIGADKFASLRFKVKDAPATITSVDIYFEDGGTQHMNINESLQPVAENRDMKDKDMMGNNKPGDKDMTGNNKTGYSDRDQDMNGMNMQTTTAGMSKEIQLTDAERSIDKIAISYKIPGAEKTSASNAKKPVVEIWGLKTNWDKEKNNSNL